MKMRETMVVVPVDLINRLPAKECRGVVVNADVLKELQALVLNPIQEEITDEQLLAMADLAFGEVVDYDFLGNQITDYRVLLMGAYGPAIRRLVKLARANPTK